VGIILLQKVASNLMGDCSKICDKLKFNDIKLLYTKNQAERRRSVSIHQYTLRSIFYDIIIAIKIIYVTINY